MQNLIYDEAPYDILFYDTNLDAYRTDRFAGWQNQPVDTGTPFFTYSTLDYTSSPTPGRADPGAVRGRGERRRRARRGRVPGGRRSRVPPRARRPRTAAAAPDPRAAPRRASWRVVAVVVVGLVWFSRRRSAAAAADEDE